MPRVRNMKVSQSTISSGDSTTVSASIEHLGNSVSLTIEITPPCTFASGETKFSTKANGASPTSVAIPAQVNAPAAGRPYNATLTLTAIDPAGQDADQSDLRIN